ncbi:MAG: NAD(P)H-dependent oxidoreductase [Devosia sp.]|uniref:NAD(P)H-dependent oxidoreductase n=1 Tax=Devosia sp. TaxID=1871048 RepID=UPI0024C99C63|nr:NAD(P)H-dependent oxidoreductase [Devosia sp.]UYN99130.1 MAG: NAD(P)H-dependent oxidoreductase [Devosia sp.]
MTISLPTHTPHVVLLSGNTHRPSKSRALAATLGQRLSERTEVRLTQLDLLDAGPHLGAAYFRTQLSPEALAVVETIERADALIVTTPVYKGSYPGLFKHLIDLLDIEALANVPVFIGATGGGQRHALVVEHQLRPLFGFFSALVNPTSLYVSDAEFSEGEPSHPQVLGRLATGIEQFAALIEARQAGKIHYATKGRDQVGLAAANA